MPAYGKKASISGTVTDSVSGRPVPSVLVSVSEARKGRVATDGDGRFLIQHVDPGRIHLEFHAPSKTLLGALIGTVQVFVESGVPAVVDYQYDEASLEEPPCESIMGEFRGVFFWGLELSDFTPEGDVLLLPGGRCLNAEDIWVEVSDLIAEFFETYVEYRVRWLATLTGPGTYGHLGVSKYSMTVHDILESEKVEDSGC